MHVICFFCPSFHFHVAFKGEKKRKQLKVQSSI